MLPSMGTRYSQETVGGAGGGSLFSPGVGGRPPLSRGGPVFAHLPSSPVSPAPPVPTSYSAAPGQTSISQPGAGTPRLPSRGAPIFQGGLR